MKYNLTEQQKELARFIVGQVRAQDLPESFHVEEMRDLSGLGLFFAELMDKDRTTKPVQSSNHLTQARIHVVQSPIHVHVPGVRIGAIDALAEAKMLVINGTRRQGRTCTLTGLIYIAVDSNFVDEEAVRPISTLAQPHPPEIAFSLDRLRTEHPDPKKLGFLIMRFTDTGPFQGIVRAVKNTGQKHKLSIVRADERQFHDDLWGNVRTFLHGCGFGIAVYERIETEEQNANIGLEVGYLMAMSKPVLLLKDQTVKTLPCDLAGKLYKPFDPHDPEGTIPEQLTKWLGDNGIIVPKAGGGV